MEAGPREYGRPRGRGCGPAVFAAGALSHPYRIDAERGLFFPLTPELMKHLMPAAPLAFALLRGAAFSRLLHPIALGGAGGGLGAGRAGGLRATRSGSRLPQTRCAALPLQTTGRCSTQKLEESSAEKP